MSDKYSNDVWECWTYYEAFRKLGFSPDDLYFSIHTDSRVGKVAGIRLRTQGLEFIVNAIKLSGSEKLLHDSWKKFNQDLNSGKLPEKELEDIYNASQVRSQHVGFAAALMAKGFKLPIG